MFSTYDILFGKLRPYFKKVVVAPCEGVCSTDILVLRPVLGDWAVCAVICSSDEVINHAIAGSEGTRMPRISWDYLSKCIVTIPKEKERHSVQSLLAPIFELGLDLVKESTALATLRDTLLPKLLSGELRVKDTESLVKEVI